MSYQQPPGGYGVPAPGPYGAPAPQPAQLADRFLARLIDGLVVGIPAGIVSVIVGGLVRLLLPGFIDDYVAGVVGAALVAAAYIGYNYYFETSSGQTLGKSVMKLRVVGPGGGPVTAQQSVRRNGFYGAYLLAVVPFLGSVLGGLALIGLMVYIAVTINNDTALRQGWHDKLAHETYVSKIG